MKKGGHVKGSPQIPDPRSQGVQVAQELLNLEVYKSCPGHLLDQVQPGGLLGVGWTEGNKKENVHMFGQMDQRAAL